MKIHRFGALIAIVGVVYLVTVAWMASWWYVPVLSKLGPGALIGRTPPGGTAFSIIWATSGVLGAIIVAFGAAVYSAVGKLRLLFLAGGGALLILWLAFWSSSSHHAVVFGVGGSLILLCFLTSCLDWARTRRDLVGSSITASDLRLAANVSFFIAAWGLCGLLGAPVFALRQELTDLHRTVGWNLAIKVLVCLVLGWGFTAVAQRMERHARKRPD